MSEFDTNDSKNQQEPLNDENTDIMLGEADLKPSKSNFLKDFVDYIEIFAFALFFVILIFSFCFRLCTVSGPSMNTTLIDGERVIITDVFYEPKRGDIIVFHNTNSYIDDLNEPIVKRVIATGGEKVSISYTSEGMTVVVTDNDGNPLTLSENYIQYDYSFPSSYGNNVYEVPEGKIFVMGDNRCNSTDSRDASIGFVDERAVLGKVIFRITPFSKIGTVK